MVCRVIKGWVIICIYIHSCMNTTDRGKNFYMQLLACTHMHTHMHTHACTYIVSEQAALKGFSSLRPFSSSWTRERGSTPG